MNTELLNKLYELKNKGWKFNHLSGCKMSVDNGIKCFIVNGTTSVECYKNCFNEIERFEKV